MYETEITIVGCGLRKQGTGKNGLPYDFVPVAFTYPDKNMEGVNAQQCLISGGDFERHLVGVGSRHKALLVFGKNNQTGKYGLLRVLLMG